MNSIRFSLTRNILIVVLGTLIILFTPSYLSTRTATIESFKNTVERDLRVVANVVKVRNDGDVYIEANEIFERRLTANGQSAFVVRSGDGSEIIERSESLNDTNLELNADQVVSKRNTVWSEEIGQNGTSVMIATRTFRARRATGNTDATRLRTRSGLPTMVQVSASRDMSELRASLRKATYQAVILTLAITVAAGFVAWITAGLALRPIQQLASRAAEIREPTDAQPFSANGKSELEPIAQRLNSLLARLKQASIIEQRFTADAAHELRTPIAELRTLTDVALAFETDADRLLHALRTSNELSIRLSTVVDALLGVARKDTLSANIQSSPLDVPKLLNRLLAEKNSSFDRNKKELAIIGPTTHIINTDPALLTSILTNLIGNAVSYSPNTSEIHIAYSGGSNGFRLDISNPAPDLNVDNLEQLFKPFWRQKGSYSDRSHSGVGLTLSRNFADLLGYTLTANILMSGHIQFTLLSDLT